MAKRIGFDDGPDEELSLSRRFLFYTIWALKDLGQRAFDFNSRTRLPIFILQFLMVSMVVTLGLRLGLETTGNPYRGWVVSFLNLGALYMFVIILVRRAHDLNVSVWSVLNVFSPIISGVKFFGLFVRPGNSEPNDYGDRKSLKIAAGQKRDRKTIG